MLPSDFQRRDQGFVLILGLSFLFIMVNALMIAFTLAQTTLDFRRNQHMCRQAVMNIMSRQADFLYQLMSLNPLARNLQRKRLMAERRLMLAVSSGNPGAIASAEAHLILVKFRQAAFHRRQLYILGRSRVDYLTKIDQSKYRMSRHNPQVLEVSSSGASQLKVRPFPPTSDSPEYVEEVPFLERQATRFYYQIRPSHFLKLLTRRNYRLNCQASITKQGDYEWRPQLLASGR